MSGYETLQVTNHGRVGHILLDLPARRNAVSATMLAELERAARALDSEPAVDVVVLAGADGAFCAGADLDNFEVFLGSREAGDAGTTVGVQQASALARLGRNAMQALEQMRATTVARVHGYAIGAGMLIAAAADFRILSEDAFLQVPEIDIGTPLLWGGIPRMVRDLGAIRTLDVVTSCRRVGAQEALAIGWATRVVPAEMLDAEVEALVSALLAKPRFALRATKEHVHAVSTMMRAGDTSYADTYLAAACWTDPEVRSVASTFVRDFRTARAAADCQ